MVLMFLCDENFLSTPQRVFHCRAACARPRPGLRSLGCGDCETSVALVF